MNILRHIAILPLAALLLPRVLEAQTAPFPLRNGEAVVTCFSGFNPNVNVRDGFVVGVVDVRNPPASNIGVNWPAPMYHGPTDNWTAGNLGQVFGVTIDTAGSIYVTATSSYRIYSTPLDFGPGGAGGVYRLDGQSGAISLLASLPNTGPALGNICHDDRHNQLFVTNFEDGRIYRLGMDGAILSTHDPYQPDDGSPGFAPRGERLWGIACYEGRVYYSVWWEEIETRRLKRAPGNEIRSVPITRAGEFDRAGDRHELWLPPLLPSIGYSEPVSSINFSDDGRMLLAERTMYDTADPNGHNSRVLEYAAASGIWGAPKIFSIGHYAFRRDSLHSNSAGGADYAAELYDIAADTITGCDRMIWATGDALRFPDFNPDGGTDFVYGLARVSASGNTPANVSTTSNFIDLDGEIGRESKTHIGSIKIFRSCGGEIDTVGIDTSVIDTLRICAGDSVRLNAPSGSAYSWSPRGGLSCSNCQTPHAFPSATTSYIATVIDSQGGRSSDTVTVVVTPRRVFDIRFGGTLRTAGEEIAVPVILDGGAPGDSTARYRITVTYDTTHLFLLDDPRGPHDSLLKGTIAEGWTVRINRSVRGAFMIDLFSLGGVRSIAGTVTLLNPRFVPLLNQNDSSTQGEITASAIFTELPCMEAGGGRDTIVAEICGDRARFMVLSEETFTLDEGSPNPTSSTTTIEFSLGLDGPARLEIFDLLGRSVAVLADGYFDAGKHTVVWDAESYPSGMYYCRLSSETWVATRRVIVR